MQVKAYLFPLDLGAKAVKKIEEMLSKGPVIIREGKFGSKVGIFEDFIIFNTTLFENLPPENQVQIQEKLKEVLEPLLRHFGQYLLIALCFPRDKRKEAIDVIWGNLDQIREKLDKIAETSSKLSPNV